MAEYPAGISHRRRISGVGHWRLQRFSAVAVLALMMYFVVTLSMIGGMDHAAAIEFVGAPVNAIALTVLLIVGLWHGMMGLEVVIEDYITISGGRHAALLLMRGTMGVIALASLWAMARIAL